MNGRTGTVTGLAEQTDLTAEAAARAAADTAWSSAVAAEASTRATADTTLQTNITAEANARVTADALVTSTEIARANAAYSAKANQRVNVKDAPYSAQGNTVRLTDVSIAAGSALLNSPTAGFVAGDVGKAVHVRRAGAASADLLPATTTILAVNSPTQVQLSATATVALVAARTLADAAMTALSSNVTSATAAFTDSDIGKTITITGAGAAGATLSSRIVSVTNATTAVLYNAAVTTVAGATLAISGGYAAYGTDDTAAFQAAALAGRVYVPGLATGRYYLLTGEVDLSTGGGFKGDGWTSRILVGADVIAMKIPAGSGNHESIEDLAFEPLVTTTKAAVQVGDTGSSVTGHWLLRGLSITADAVLRTLMFDTGIRTIGAITGVIDDCFINNTVTAGIWLSKNTGSPPNAVRVVNGECANNGTYGIKVEDSDGGLDISAMVVEGTITYGVYLTNVRYGGVTDVYFENTGTNVYFDVSHDCTLTRGYYHASSAKSVVIASTSAAITLNDVAPASSTVQIENNSGSVVTVRGGTYNPALCTGLTGARVRVIAARDGVTFNPLMKLDPELDAIGGLTSAADTFPYFTGSGAAALATVSAFMRTVLDDANAATALATLGAAAQPPNLVIAPAALFVGAGTASMSNSNNWPVLSVPKGSPTDQRLAFTFMQPNAWLTFDVELWWTNLSAGAGDVPWQVQSATLINGGTTATPGIVTTTTIAAPAQNVGKVSTLATGLTIPTANQMMLVRVLRIATDAADTLAGAAGIFEVRLKRAS